MPGAVDGGGGGGHYSTSGPGVWEILKEGEK